jgi:hypothetical protein
MIFVYLHCFGLWNIPDWGLCLLCSFDNLRTINSFYAF